MHKIVLIFLLMTFGINAQEWVVITPLPHCQEFQIEFNFDNGYVVRYKEHPNSGYTTHNKTLENINDLNSMTDVLVSASENFCKLSDLSVKETPIELDGITCHEVRDNSKPFSDSYAGLLKDIIGVINKSGDNCDDVIPLIELQQEISQLGDNDLITFNKESSFFKNFADDEQDLLIDHFYECGGKKGSKKFIENLILIETKNACLFPEPPGMLSFEKAKLLAKKIASKYPNYGLFKLSRKTDEITKDVVQEFVNEILKSNVKSILGENTDPNLFVESLDVMKNLKNTKDDKALDYASYILKLDAPLEIIDKGIDHLIKANFTSMLPKSLTQAQKDDFINTEITPKVKQVYNSCITNLKQVVKYPNPYTGKKKQSKLIEHRKHLEKEFCNKNKDICSNKTCGASPINLGSLEPDVTDMGQMQACLFSSLTDSIKPLFKIIIADQKDAFKEYFDLNDQMVVDISDKAFEDLYNCSDKKIKKISGDDYKEGFTKDITALYKISPDEFVSVLKSCAEKTEENLTGDFVTLLVANMEPVKEAYSSSESVLLYGETLDKSASNFARRIVAETVPACVKKQREQIKINPNLKLAASNCRVNIEAHAAAELIKSTIQKTYKENNISKRQTTFEIESFDKCVEETKNDISSALLNSEHKTPITNSNEADQFFENNHNFYNCVSTLVVNTADLIADSSITKLITDKGDELSEPEVLKALQPKAVSIAKACFKEKMNLIGSWPGFKKFNSEDGLKQLEAQCTQRATEYILPKVILTETKSKLGSLIGSNIVNEEEVNLVLTKISDKLISDYNITVPRGIKIPTDEYIVKEAYRIFSTRSENKDVAINNFIEEIYANTLGSIIPEIKSNIIDEVVERSKPGFDFSELKTIISPKCLNDFYDINKVKIEDLVSLISKNNTSDQKTDLRELFIEYVQKGLIRARLHGRYYKMTEELSKMCKAPGEYKDLTKIVNSGIGDDIFINVIHTKLKSSLNEVATEQCFKDIEEYQIKILPDLLSRLCSETNLNAKERSSLESDLLIAVTNPKERSQLNFIMNKKFNADRLVHHQVHRSFAEELLYKDKDILNYVYQNIDKISAGIPKYKTQLNLLIVDKIFNQKKKTQFARDFIENQIVGGIGVEGYDIALREVKANLKELPWYYKVLDSAGDGLITTQANNVFNSKWRYNGVKHYLNLNATSTALKDELMENVYKHAIVPMIDSSVDKDTKEAEREKLGEYVEQYIAESKPHDNPNYIPPSTKDIMGGEVELQGTAQKLSFKEKFAIDMENTIAKGVKSDLGSRASGIFE